MACSGYDLTLFQIGHLLHQLMVTDTGANCTISWNKLYKVCIDT